MPTAKLKYHTGLEHIISGIRVCWASEDKSDSDYYQIDSALDDPAYVHLNGKLKSYGPKDLALIDRIANKLKHSSVLRHSLYVFECVASTKTLLAFTRHSVGVNFGVQSTRYTTSKQGASITFTPSRSAFVNERIEQTMQMVQECIAEGVNDDDLAMLLPQAYNYRFQVSLNAQALQHFFTLRGGADSHAHYDINALANEMYNQLPNGHKFIFDHCIN